jgi:4-aminobutyrate aminotransferase
LGAIIAKDSIMDWPSGSHANTFGGNPVACQAALVTIDLLEREYLANAHARGLELRAGLQQLASTYANLKNPRGLGLMVAVDVIDPDQPPRQQANPRLRDRIIQAAFEHGLLLLGCGETAIRFCPPLCITTEQVEKCLEILNEVLQEVTLVRGEVVHS